MLFEGKTPETEPSRMPAILAAAGVGFVLTLFWAAAGVKGGAIPALINIGAVVGTYRLVRNSQLKKPGG